MNLIIIATFLVPYLMIYTTPNFVEQNSNTYVGPYIDASQDAVVLLSGTKNIGAYQEQFKLMWSTSDDLNVLYNDNLMAGNLSLKEKRNILCDHNNRMNLNESKFEKCFHDHRSEMRWDLNVSLPSTQNNSDIREAKIQLTYKQNFWGKVNVQEDDALFVEFASNNGFSSAQLKGDLMFVQEASLDRLLDNGSFIHKQSNDLPLSSFVWDEWKHKQNDRNFKSGINQAKTGPHVATRPGRGGSNITFSVHAVLPHMQLVNYHNDFWEITTTIWVKQFAVFVPCFVFAQILLYWIVKTRRVFQTTKDNFPVQ